MPSQFDAFAQRAPKSPIGIAIRYAIGQWDELGRFPGDARIPLDNNASERALRRVALGRKNFLFVGNLEAGVNLAALYSLVATCEARGINPFAYLVDVLSRLGEHPVNRLDELLTCAIQGRDGRDRRAVSRSRAVAAEARGARGRP